MSEHPTDNVTQLSKARREAKKLFILSASHELEGKDALTRESLRKLNDYELENLRGQYHEKLFERGLTHRAYPKAL